MAGARYVRMVLYANDDIAAASYKGTMELAAGKEEYSRFS